MSERNFIFLDTETTGLEPANGEKIVEIGCIKVGENLSEVIEEFHCFLNPKKVMGQEVIAIHGITNEFLVDKPQFHEVADKFVNFLGDVGKTTLVIHNAKFDLKFLNYELKAIQKEDISHFTVEDTVHIAKRKFPGSKVNLNDLCVRFRIDIAHRTKHGALIDAELLWKLYRAMKEEDSGSSNLISTTTRSISTDNINYSSREQYASFYENFFLINNSGSNLVDRKVTTLTEEEEKLHSNFLSEKISDPIWNKR